MPAIPSSRLQVVLARQQGTAFSLKYRIQDPLGDWILAALEIEGLNRRDLQATFLAFVMPMDKTRGNWGRLDID